ncbi:hypothetical protein B0A53_05690 [Rhodotorula sp. CCFEE 5036]|nr:hypothetical protein B0A53_05690 [Rhodotorula sp. CCFEE 5036]
MFTRRAVQAVRSYATQASSSAPPIQIQGLAGKYAGALFTAAAKANALQQVESDLKGVKATVGTDAKIHDFLSNPILSHQDRAAGLDALLSASVSAKGAKGPSDLTRNLFSVLAENGRLYETDKVVDGFLEIMQAHRGEVKVVITTAQPLEKDLQKRLEDALKQSQMAQAGKKSLVFENRINEGALGGVIIDVGDKTIDLSVASRVSRLNQQLEEGI